MDNMVFVERIKFRDIIETFRNLFATSENKENSEITNKKLQRVYEVEKELGATERINSREKFLGIFASKVSRKKSIEKVGSVQVEVKNVSANIIDNSIEDELEK